MFFAFFIFEKKILDFFSRNFLEHFLCLLHFFAFFTFFLFFCVFAFFTFLRFLCFTITISPSDYTVPTRAKAQSAEFGQYRYRKLSENSYQNYFNRAAVT